MNTYVITSIFVCGEKKLKAKKFDHFLFADGSMVVMYLKILSCQYNWPHCGHLVMVTRERAEIFPLIAAGFKKKSNKIDEWGVGGRQLMMMFIALECY